MTSGFKGISYSEYSNGFISTLKFCFPKALLFPRVFFVPEILGPHRDDPQCPAERFLLSEPDHSRSHLRVPPMATGATWNVQKEQQACVTSRAMPIHSLSCSISYLPSYIQNLCQLYLVTLGGPHSAKGKGLVFPLLDLDQKILNLEMRKFLFGKVCYPSHLIENSEAHFYMSEAPSMWVPSVCWADSLVPALYPITLFLADHKWSLTHSLDFVQKKHFLSPAFVARLGETCLKYMVCALLEPVVQSWEGAECSFHLSLLHFSLLIPLSFLISFPETMQNWTGTKYAEFKVSTLEK